jgi:folylpolyglutamate synthase/dihydropteroate synthase
VLAEPPLTIADVAHNVDGIRVIRSLLECTPYEELHIVLGMVSDKDISAVLAELPQRARYYFCKADIPRGLDAAAGGIAQLVQSICLTSRGSLVRIRLPPQGPAYCGPIEILGC